jgi:hypothetical protein
MREITPQDLYEIREHFPIDACLHPPDMTVSPAAAQDFNRLFEAACAQGANAVIPYDLPYPKYLFLEYLSTSRRLMFHGSNNRAIDVLRPIRMSSDSSEFGNQDAIYATQDPLWALFFAVLDKDNMGAAGTSNGAIQAVNEAGQLLRRYYFTVEAGSLRQGPWLPGAMYILPGGDFEPDPAMQGVTAGPYTLVATHWIHRGELAPLARLDVEPEDFPFLHHMWGYDLARYMQRMEAASLAGFPFLDDPEVYPIRPGA